MKKLLISLAAVAAVATLAGCAKNTQTKDMMPQQDQGAYQSGDAGKLSSSKLGTTEAAK